MHYLFTDEAGAWSNVDDVYYVRSWLKIKAEDSLRIQKQVDFNKL